LKSSIVDRTNLEYTTTVLGVEPKDAAAFTGKTIATRAS
jgi:hypothetical protein